MPRRRRGASAVAIDPDAERGLVMRILLHSPKDMVAGALAFAAVSAIVANALWLQAGRHPSPMFGSVVAMPATPVAAANPLPRPRPLDADVTAFEAKLNEPKAPDPLANLVKASSAPMAVPAAIARPPAPIPAASRSDALASAGSRRVAAVQRTLTEYGYGQLKADRHRRLRHPGRDPEIRAGAQDPGDRADVGSAGAGTRGDGRAFDRLARAPDPSRHADARQRASRNEGRRCRRRSSRSRAFAAAPLFISASSSMSSIISRCA